MHSSVCAVTSTSSFLISSAVASMDPEFRVSSLLGNLFYIKRLTSSGHYSERDLASILPLSDIDTMNSTFNYYLFFGYSLNFWKSLRKLASSSARVPLILQILVPMLREDANYFVIHPLLKLKQTNTLDIVDYSIHQGCLLLKMTSF